MIDENKKRMSEIANEAIEQELNSRFPVLWMSRVDDNPTYVMQSDLYGYVDTIIQTSSERIYTNQNKSRRDSKEDICIECRSFRGTPETLATGKPAPIAGAHWSQVWQRWLSPRFGQTDTLTYYLPKVGFVGHFNRYFLEILLSKPETWEHTTGMHKLSGDCDTIIVFWNYKIFTRMYLETVKEITSGTNKEDEADGT